MKPLSSRNAMPIITYQLRLWRFPSSTIEPIVLSSDAYVCCPVISWSFRGSRAMLCRDLRVRVADAAEIACSRPGVQFFEQKIAPLICPKLAHAAFLISHVAKNDRLRGTRLLAGRHDLAVLDIAALFLGLDPGVV